jgi:hypothetical protein
MLRLSARPKGRRSMKANGTWDAPLHSVRLFDQAGCCVIVIDAIEHRHRVHLNFV